MTSVQQRVAPIMPVAPRRFSIVRNRPLLTLMLGHFTIDMYSGLLPVLYPVLTGAYSLNLETVGLVTLAYSGMGSVSQPLFGWIADRYGTRLIGLALLWTAAVFSTIGFAPSFPLLLTLAAAAGLGSGMYHPFGALNASAVISDEQRNTAMSIYVTGGTFGLALGPLVGAAAFSLLGLHGTALMIIPGLLTAPWLLLEMRKVAPRRVARVKSVTVPSMPVPLLPLLAVIAVMMSRSWTVQSLQAFIPTWYKSLGYGPSFYGPLATTLVLASALGTIGAGSLADRYGRRMVTIGALVLTVPVILIFAESRGPLSFVTAALVGFLAASTAPLMLVMAQQLIAGRAGMASGLILGLGFGAGAVGVPVMGALADKFGFLTALRLQSIIVLLTIGIAFLLPSETYLRGLAHRSRATTAGPRDELPALAAGADDV